MSKIAMGIPRMGENLGRDDGNPVVDRQKRLFAWMCILTIIALRERPQSLSGADFVNTPHSYSWACRRS